MKEKITAMKLCLACRRRLVSIGVGGELGKVFICTNERCPRFGLLSVVSVRFVKKGKGGEGNEIHAQKVGKQKK